MVAHAVPVDPHAESWVLWQRDKPVGVDFDAEIWYGLHAPAKTPQALANKISEDQRKVMADPDTQSRLREAGVQPSYMSPGEMGQLMQKNVAHWREVITRIKLSLD